MQGKPIAWALAIVILERAAGHPVLAQQLAQQGRAEQDHPPNTAWRQANRPPAGLFTKNCK